MASLAYRIFIDNDDRNEHSVKYFSTQWQADQFFDKYKMAPGDQVRLFHVPTSEKLSEK
jgi:hypothetical protein